MSRMEDTVLRASIDGFLSDITVEVTGSGVSIDERSERATCSDAGSPFCYVASIGRQLEFS